MTLLAAYILLTLFAVVWILRDAETVFIFDVFGKSFYYVWYESGKRWTYLFTYGWRLALLCSIIVVNLFLVYRFLAADPLRLGWPFVLVLSPIMLLGSFAALPWISAARPDVPQVILLVSPGFSGAYRGGSQETG
jgi:hypothetical protein